MTPSGLSGACGTEDGREDDCPTCLGHGRAWASAAAMPHGFKLFVGNAVRRSPDRSEMLLVCWHCNGSGKQPPAITGKD